MTEDQANSWRFPAVISGDQVRARKRLARFFMEKTKNFFNKKRPVGDNYPYHVADPYMVFGGDTAYTKTYLVGRNWRQSADSKPIALMIGFNDWKYGFVSDYLPEYRTAFAPRKLTNMGAARLLQRLRREEAPAAIVVWGYTAGPVLEFYAKRAGVSIIRVEDGFIRSSALGASHSTPYSLVFDSAGLYYDCTRPSDIENILNTYDFGSDPVLLKQAEAVLGEVTEWKVSKYNPAVICERGVVDSIKTRERVLVLGQVDNDSSIRFGNPDGWTTEELIQLARYENQEAEVLYRPHPEVFRGYQKSRLKRKRVEQFATIVSPNEPLIELLETVDRVYTITSLAGLDALLRGIKVTVVGAPFYSGWGLTDDRARIERRQTKRTLVELFAAAYLVYPRYLADRNDSVIGLRAAARRIRADWHCEMFRLYQKLEPSPASALAKARSPFWPQLLFDRRAFAADVVNKAIAHVDYAADLGARPGCLFQVVYLYSICGALEEGARDKFLHGIRARVKPSVLNDLLLDLVRFHPGAYLSKHFAWLLSEGYELALSAQVMESELERMLAPEQNEAEIEDGHDAAPPQAGACALDAAKAALLLDYLETHRENKDFAKAVEVCKVLMITGNSSSLVFLRMAEFAELRFDPDSARQIARFHQRFALTLHNRGALHLEIENAPTETSGQVQSWLAERIALQLTTNPDRINRTWAMLKGHFSTDRDAYGVFRALLNLDNDQTFQKALAYLEIDEPDRARHVIEALIAGGSHSDKESVVYSKVLFALGEQEKALSVIRRAFAKRATHDNCTELLRLLKSLGRFEEALAVLESVDPDAIGLTEEGQIMPIYFGLKQIERGFRCFLDTAVKRRLIKNFGWEKYKHSDSLDVHGLLLICSFGPAEEIRFASLYDEIAGRLGPMNFKLTCDYRLHAILERSFPDIQFVPVKRTRWFSPQYRREDYDQLPSAELIDALDNTGLAAVNEAQEIGLLTELLWQFRKDYEDFKHKGRYLLPDPEKVKELGKRLPKDKRLVGLSWRSSLTNSMRNVHYLQVEQLAPLLEVEGVTYINLQYDDCEDELAWIEERYPGKVINLPDIDQFNDFDSVAALMDSLELVISPVTAVIELAGALDVPGLLFSNHGELWWRETGPHRTDVWYGSVRHVRTTVGDKESLVRAIAKEVSDLVQHPTPASGREAVVIDADVEMLDI